MVLSQACPLPGAVCTQPATLSGHRSPHSTASRSAAGTPVPTTGLYHLSQTSSGHTSPCPGFPRASVLLNHKPSAPTQVVFGTAWRHVLLPHPIGWRVATGIQWEEARDSAKPPTILRTAPATSGSRCQ